MKTLKRTWADISLDNLEYNYRSIRAHLPQGTKFLGVMKADAYGHGAVPVSRALADLGAEYLAVSNLEEAVQICAEKARPGDAVLLSPACASWGQFDNYEQRGRKFKEYVHQL